ncbi:hypothetical protein EDEG_01962 [Edhazardia aedis USNM 41457]|uniref:Uncharacterized protein n=1 Tax=Edhazardia aedis (strain USNM 41457) TaxID=1003232 RepID=J9DR06_EDHAE|nr:hypothetical protein EDEG_01962 [Edhazardia aedis USNM 41457]|eukprot:EJW03767.1 hypothetical protein EDEG_01962 [Edhazardia aedis USNM 41457]
MSIFLYILGLYAINSEPELLIFESLPMSSKLQIKYFVQEDHFLILNLDHKLFPYLSRKKNYSLVRIKENEKEKRVFYVLYRGDKNNIFPISDDIFLEFNKVRESKKEENVSVNKKTEKNDKKCWKKEDEEKNKDEAKNKIHEKKDNFDVNKKSKKSKQREKGNICKGNKEDSHSENKIKLRKKERKIYNHKLTIKCDKLLKKVHEYAWDAERGMKLSFIVFTRSGKIINSKEVLDMVAVPDFTVHFLTFTTSGIVFTFIASTLIKSYIEEEMTKK